MLLSGAGVFCLAILARQETYTLSRIIWQLLAGGLLTLGAAMVWLCIRLMAKQLYQSMMLPPGAESAHILKTNLRDDTAELRYANERLQRELAARKRMEMKLKIRARQQAAVAELGQRALVGTNLLILYEEVVSAVVQTLGTEHSTIFELSLNGQSLQLQANVGWEGGLESYATLDADPDSLEGFTLHSDQPVVIEDLVQEPRFRQLRILHDFGIVSSMSVAIHGRNGPVGVLGTYSTSRRNFTEDDIHFFQAFANVLAMAIERKRAEHHMIQRNRALLTLQSAGAAIASSLDLQYVLNTVTREMASLLEVEACAISEWNHLGDTVSLIAEYGPDHWRTEISEGKIYCLTEYPHIKQVLIERRILQMTFNQSDIDSAEFTHIRAKGLVSLLILPMIFQNRVIGLAELMDSRKERTFTQQEIALVQLLANQAASSIENAQLYAETRKILREQIALRETVAVISSTLDLKTVVSHLAEQMGRLADVSSARICSIDPGTSVVTVLAEYFRSPTGSNDSDLGATYHLPQDLPDSLKHLEIGQARPVHLDDPDLTESERAIMQRYGVKTKLTIPLQIGGQIIAYAELRESSQRREFSSEEITLYQDIAQQAAIAIENARLYGSIEQYLEELTTLNMISQVITSTLDLEEMLAIITRQTIRLLDVEAASVALYDEAEGDLWFSASAGEISDFVRGKRLPLGQGIIGWVVQHGEPVLVPDTSREPRFFDQFDQERAFTTRSILCVPLHTKGQTIGAIEALNKNGAFDREDLRLLSSLAARAATAIENAQLFKQTQQEIAERKRAEEALKKGVEQLELTYRQAIIYAQELKEEITERKRAEAALEIERSSLAKRVAERTADLSTANRKLAKAARLKDEFLASMSHELRTPLSAILGLSEVMKTSVYGPLTDKQLSALSSIEESGRHLLALINDILDLSKIGAGKLDLRIGPVFIEGVCQASLRFVKQDAQKKHIKVSCSCEVTDVTLQADERRLKQILVNLLSNAVKFTPEGGAIGLDVTGDVDRQEVHFTVWDNGIGIPPEYMNRLFQPFVQLDSRLSRQYAGTGLGLALVQRMVEMHGGQVSVESEVGQGSRFTIALPLSGPAEPIEPVVRPSLQAAMAKAGLATGSQEPSLTIFASDGNDEVIDGLITQEIVSTAPQSKAPLILLAEDEKKIASILTDYLSTRNYRMVIADNGLEAVELTQKETPDVILMDVQMPKMDGLQAIKTIRSDKEQSLANIPIIALTALAMSGDRERCLAAGANDYLSKPVRLENLVQAIERQLNRN